VDETRRHAELVKQALERVGTSPSPVKTALGTMLNAVQSYVTGSFQDEMVKNGILDYAISSKLAFIGGFDARILETNDRDLIQREVGNYIEGMKSKGARLVFASDHSISTNVHYDSYRYAVDEYRKHMMY
jgi:uroporphyrinogen-III decarboxylase